MAVKTIAQRLVPIRPRSAMLQEAVHVRPPPGAVELRDSLLAKTGRRSPPRQTWLRLYGAVGIRSHSASVRGRQLPDNEIAKRAQAAIDGHPYPTKALITWPWPLSLWRAAATALHTGRPATPLLKSWRPGSAIGNAASPGWACAYSPFASSWVRRSTAVLRATEAEVIGIEAPSSVERRRPLCGESD